jgi:histidyl-tRNA synthetase
MTNYRTFFPLALIILDINEIIQSLQMDTTKMQTLKGFRDFLPETMVVRNEVIGKLRQIFEKYGFDEIQTPTLEYQEVLLGKYGEEADKLIYLFEDQGQRNVGMRYDLTIPLARFIANYPDLPKPFRRFQLQPVWRSDKPQKGRYREIYQCDVDIVGSPSPLSDAEILAIINDSLKTLEFPSFRIRVNSRQVLFSSMENAKVEKNMWLSAIQTIDKLDKKEKEEVEKELSEKGLANEQIKDIFTSLINAKPDQYLAQVIEIAEKLGAGDSLKFDSTLARGLDYYTGPIFESVVDKPKIGSITGGGRYDHLLKALGGPDLPAVGTTIGLDRAADVIEELHLWKNLNRTTTSVLVTVFNNNLFGESALVAANLRENGINTELYPDEKADLRKQFKYADKKGVEWLVVIGPDEVEKNMVVLKNLKTGEQDEIKLEKLIPALNSKT